MYFAEIPHSEVILTWNEILYYPKGGITLPSHKTLRLQDLQI